MKTNRTIFSCGLLLLLAASLLVPADSHAEEMSGDEMAMHYVIKVTPTLAYLDVGQASGAMVGSEFTVLREDEDDDEMMIVVGEVRVLRVYAGFSIAEITSVEPEEELAVLQRVIPRAEAMSMDMMSGGDGERAAVAQERPAGATLTRSIVLLGGMDLNKATDLRWGTNVLDGAEDVSGPAIGIRLARMFTPKVRVALTYRLSGEPLGPTEAAVTQMSAEVDAHILFRPADQAGPYVGVGGSLHLLTWDAPSEFIDDSAFKTGFNVVGGLQIPFSAGRWSLFAEGGYQGVTKWADRLDASHVRAYAGLGRNF